MWDPMSKMANSLTRKNLCGRSQVINKMPKIAENAGKFGSALLMGTIGVLATSSVAFSADLALGSQVFSGTCGKSIP